MTKTATGPRQRGRYGRWLVALSAAATAIATYLAIVKLTGGTPICSVVEGCEVVNDSEHSILLGMPVAVLGVAASVVTIAGALAWWSSADRRGLLVAYGVGLASIPVLAWLTYVEVAVLRAVCVWCVAYASLVASGWIVATLASMRDRRITRGET